MISSVYVAVLNRHGGFVEGRRFSNAARLRRFRLHCDALGLTIEEYPE